jgi:hypothetical protein
MDSLNKNPETVAKSLSNRVIGQRLSGDCRRPRDQLPVT